MPRAPRRCGRRDCDELMPCLAHAYVEQRGSSTARGYGVVHRDRASDLKDEAQRDDLPCSLCSETFDWSLRHPHPRSFVAHHLTRDKSGPIAPAHKRCNEHAHQPPPLVPQGPGTPSLPPF